MSKPTVPVKLIFDNGKEFKELNAFGEVDPDGKVRGYIFPAGTDMDTMFEWLDLMTSPNAHMEVLGREGC